MRWLLNAQALRERGVLGMNRRNADYILPANAPAAIALVDDKLRVHRLCSRIDVPTPHLFDVIAHFGELRRIGERLPPDGDFVVKPSRGSGGRGVLVVAGRDGSRFRRASGRAMTETALAHHLADILSGMHSLGGRPDAALIQQRIRLHPEFAPIAVSGIPDLRVIIYRGEPAMAMLRLPTAASNGRANLHQGGIGVGIELATGITHDAVLGAQRTYHHPNTGGLLIGRLIPHWKEILVMSRRVADAVALGYLGVDIVVDPASGPLLLEVNARPGLAIQQANGKGLLPRLAAIEAGQSIAGVFASQCQQAA